MVQWYWDQIWENGTSSQQKGKLWTNLIYRTKFSKVSGQVAPGSRYGSKGWWVKTKKTKMETMRSYLCYQAPGIPQPADVWRFIL